MTSFSYPGPSDWRTAVTFGESRGGRGPSRKGIMITAVASCVGVFAGTSMLNRAWNTELRAGVTVLLSMWCGQQTDYLLRSARPCSSVLSGSQLPPNLLVSSKLVFTFARDKILVDHTLQNSLTAVISGLEQILEQITLPTNVVIGIKYGVS
jgi:hypothetical protein